MSTVLRTEAAQRRVALGPLSLEHGGHLEDVHIACELHGVSDAPAVLVLGGISAGRRLLPRPDDPGWWPGVAGRGRVIDSSHYRVISMDWLGGRGDSSHVQAGEHVPVLTTRDQARALATVLDALDVRRLHCVIGASYGGMVALALAEQRPGIAGRYVILGAAHRTHPHAAALRSLQRRIVRLGSGNGAAAEAVGVARALAMTTYRTAAEFDERFTGAPSIVDGRVRVSVDDWFDHHAALYASSFPASALLTLSQSLDLHRIDPARVSDRCALIAFDPDTLVPAADVRALAAALGERATLDVIPTRFGHDGFLKESEIVSAILARELDGRAEANETSSNAPVATCYAARVRPDTRAPATAAARAGVGTDTQHGAVIPPIHLSTTYSFAALGEKRRYDYTRSGNPTRDTLAAAIAELEQGAAGIVTASGMAAVAATLQLLHPYDLIIAAHDGYGGTYRLLQALARRHAFRVRFEDLTQPSATQLIADLRPRMVWVETPSNPLLRITDIAAIAAAARSAGALCVVDNTFLSPALQTPLTLGADVVVHSTTKYLNGHSDVVGGAVVAADPAVAEEIGWWANCTGATGSPFDSYLALRGLRTLHARIRVHEENAAATVDVLQSAPAVLRVHYPGLSRHPGHAVARAQQRGFGAMISFELRGTEQVRECVARLRHFSLAESLGGVESLIAHPATMTHASMDEPTRRHAGITDTLLRLSVGIESCEDLVGDLRRALQGLA